MAVQLGSAYPAALLAGTDLTGCTVTLTVTSPTGVVTTLPGVINGSGATAVVPATTVGVWLLVWTITGQQAGVVQDQFTVKAPAPDLISLPDLKEELNLSPADTSRDAKLRRWIAAANDVIENITGPVRPQPRTSTFDGGVPYLVLPVARTAAITTVTETFAGTDLVLTLQPFGVPATADGYVWDPVANILERRDAGGYPTLFRAGAGGVQVVYVAGMATIPDDVQLAAAELVRHWYRKNDVPVRSGIFGATPADDTVMVGNYMLPNAVVELLGPWRRAPQVA